MSAPASISIVLSDEEAAFIARKVASNEHESPAAVIHQGLSELIEYDAAIERWLREEVVPTIALMDEDPSRGVPADDVFKELRQRILGATRAAE